MDLLDDFFDCLESPQPLTENFEKDDLDEYFECIEAPQLIPQKFSQPVLANCRKPRKGFLGKYQKKKLDVHNIQNELAAYGKCCARICLTILTWQVVLSGRLQYVGLESNEQRRKFMEKHETLKEMTGSSFQYTIPGIDGQNFHCCTKAWRFLYGITAWAHKQKPFKKKKKPRRNISVALASTGVNEF